MKRRTVVHAILAVAVAVAVSFPGISNAAAQWSAPQPLGAPTVEYYPTVGVLPSGVAYAVAYSSAGSWMYKHSITVTDEWSLVGRVSYSLYPALAIDRSGKSVLATHNGSSNLYAKTAASPEGLFYAPEQQIESGASFMSGQAQQVTIDANGNANAVWMVDSGRDNVLRTRIWASRYTPTPAPGSWSTPVALDNGEHIGAGYVRISTDNTSGKTVAVWQQYRDGSYTGTISASIWTPATGIWSTPVQISKNGVSAAMPDVAVDPAGKAVAIWSQDNSNLSSVGNLMYASRYNGSTWGAPVLIDNAARDLGGIYYPRISMDQSGNALAAWAYGRVYANYFTAKTSTWRGVMTVDTGIDQPVSDDYPAVVLDPNGKNGMVVWQRTPTSGTRQIWANKFGGSRLVFSGAAAISNTLADATLTAIVSPLAGDGSAHYTAAWSQDAFPYAAQYR